MDKKFRKGICRCIQYKKEISDLKELVRELRLKEAELYSIRETETAINSVDVNIKGK